ncbi:hypothetical protein [Maribacter polysaccharolyticus]|uniref:hypothetical protein n=1 Tax=Maribacter polysaccharolyticus TaxID=3020831 RepID=UPI00237F0E82|nr:hypothetical protein [Maribacter polysaccharolyticus]MDE3740205.1 hypothetical protein [Maribacter polysaccharolyticus]
MGFLFSADSEAPFKEAEGNNKRNTLGRLWFTCLPGISFGDARSMCCKRFWTKSKPIVNPVPPYKEIQYTQSVYFAAYGDEITSIANSFTLP